MAVSAAPPLGGIVAKVGEKSLPLVLRNSEIERFEKQHGVGIFAMLDRLLGRGEPPQARHIRDLVALGLIGAGMPDRAADDTVSVLGPSHNMALRTIAHDLVLVAFLPEKPQKKSSGVGSRRKKPVKPTSGTLPAESGASSQPA